jgi:hypothetical protein
MDELFFALLRMALERSDWSWVEVSVQWAASRMTYLYGRDLGVRLGCAAGRASCGAVVE